MTKRSDAIRRRARKRIAATHANCSLCGEPIDYTLHWPDPRSFVVDHTIPIAKGGADNLTNQTATHASCNSKKRARLIAPIVRRSGSLG